jgi:hypothetical protein
MHWLGASPLSLIMPINDQPRFLVRQMSFVGNNHSGALGMTRSIETLRRFMR